MVYRTTPRVKRRKAERRQQILDVATRLFAERGYHRTTVPMIVAESGSSTGAFYLCFANKEELFVQVLVRIGERLAEHLNQAMAGEDDTVRQMRTAVEQLFLFLVNHPAEARVLVLEASGLGGPIATTQAAILESHARSVQQALLSLASEIGSGDAAVAAHCWVGAVHQAVRHWLSLPAKERPPAGETANAVAQFNLRGIGQVVVE